MFCRKCGAENKEESQYCSKCGALLRPVSGEKKMQTPKKGKKGALGIVLIVLAVVLIAGIFITVNKVKEKQYKSNVTSADRYLKDMDYEKAEDHYLKAVSYTHLRAHET